MSASGLDLDAILVGTVEPPTGEEAVRAAERVIWHAKSLADAEMLMEMLGIDEPPAFMTHPRCGQLLGSIVHMRRCERQALEARVEALAESVGAPS